MFAFVVFDLVFQYVAKRLAGMNVSEMCLVRRKTLTQSIVSSIHPVGYFYYDIFIAWTISSKLLGFCF